MSLLHPGTLFAASRLVFAGGGGLAALAALRRHLLGRLHAAHPRLAAQSPHNIHAHQPPRQGYLHSHVRPHHQSSGVLSWLKSASGGMRPHPNAHSLPGMAKSWFKDGSSLLLISRFMRHGIAPIPGHVVASVRPAGAPLLFRLSLGHVSSARPFRALGTVFCGSPTPRLAPACKSGLGASRRGFASSAAQAAGPIASAVMSSANVSFRLGVKINPTMILNKLSVHPDDHNKPRLGLFPSMENTSPRLSPVPIGCNEGIMPRLTSDHSTTTTESSSVTSLFLSTSEEYYPVFDLAAPISQALAEHASSPSTPCLPCFLVMSMPSIESLAIVGLQARYIIRDHTWRLTMALRALDAVHASAYLRAEIKKDHSAASNTTLDEIWITGDRFDECAARLWCARNDIDHTIVRIVPVASQVAISSPISVELERDSPAQATGGWDRLVKQHTLLPEHERAHHSRSKALTQLDDAKRAISQAGGFRRDHVQKIRARRVLNSQIFDHAPIGAEAPGSIHGRASEEDSMEAVVRKFCVPFEQPRGALQPTDTRLYDTALLGYRNYASEMESVQK